MNTPELDTDEPLPDKDEWIQRASIKVNDSPWTQVKQTIKELKRCRNLAATQVSPFGVFSH